MSDLDEQKMYADLMTYPGPGNDPQNPAIAAVLKAAYDMLPSQGECGAEDFEYGTCNLPIQHESRMHQEWRNGTLWAEWSGDTRGYVEPVITDVWAWWCPICKQHVDTFHEHPALDSEL